MKHFLLFAAVLFGFAQLNAQSDVVLNINHMCGDESFAFNTEFSTDDYELNFDRLEYYVSEIKIIHDGGQETMIEDTWLLVNGNDNGQYDLGMVDFTTIEGIKFSIGVDADHNHLDPASYPSGHPLSYQSPSMHWGWASGYRFVAVEGKTGMNLLYTWEIHALGDANYHEVQLTLGSTEESGEHHIYVNADYLGMFENNDISSGVIEHSESGAAAILLDNMQDYVFSPGVATSVDEVDQMSFSIFPNPVSEELNIVLDREPSANTTMTLSDLNGKVVMNEVLGSASQKFSVEGLQQGVYMLSIYDNGSLMTTEKLVIR